MVTPDAVAVGCVGLLVVACCVWRVVRRREVHARVVRTDPDGAVVVESDGAARLWAEHPAGAGEPPAVAVGDRVRVGVPEAGTDRVPLRYTPRTSVAPLGFYGVVLLWLAVTAPWEASYGIGLVPLLVVGALPFVGVGPLVGRAKTWLLGRRIRASVTDTRSYDEAHNRSLRPRETYQAELEYETDGHRRRRWGPGAYQIPPETGQRVLAVVDPRNPGVVVDFPLASSVVSALVGTVSLALVPIAVSVLRMFATG